jgi:branched-chain amino acid transport system permease protein
MTEFLSLTIAGLVTGCIYSISALGLVVTYTTSGVFNFAHGAVGMICAFLFWVFWVDLHWPTLLALALVLLVIAPAIGWFIERFLIRGVANGGLILTATVTLGLLLFLLGLADSIWHASTGRSVPQFFNGHEVTIFQTVVTYHDIVIAACAVFAALFLRFFLHRTRVGVTMRAVVDDPRLVGLAGGSPSSYAGLGWIFGAVLAALAGILLSSVVNLDAETLTLLVVNAFAAAILGRLRSLPITFVGGILLGLVTSYAIGYLPIGSLLSTLQSVTPMVFLVVVLLLLSDRRLATNVQKLKSPRMVSLPKSVVVGAMLVVIGVVVAETLSPANLVTAGYGVAIALILLTFIPLTGYGGQMSLCQFTLAGVGGVTMSKVAGGHSWWGLLLAMVVAGAVGVVIAMPALRVRGLYLALATLAFADAMDSAFFNNSSVVGVNGAVAVGRVNLGPISLQGDKAYFIAMVVVFALAGIGICALRRSRWGRYLFAMSDSEVAATTFGMNLTLVKIALFGGTAALAGLAGALYGGEQHLVGPSDFTLLLSLTGLLVVTLSGIRTVSGAFIAALGLTLFTVLGNHISVLHTFVYFGVGLGAVGLGRNPNGLMGGPSLIVYLRRRFGWDSGPTEGIEVAPGQAALGGPVPGN